MKYLFLAVILLSSVTIQAQKSTKSISFSLKEKVTDIISQNFIKVDSKATNALEVSIVPNPITSHLHVNSTHNIKRILLVDNEGKVVKRVRLQNSKSHTFDTSSLDQDSYQVIISHYGHKNKKVSKKVKKDTSKVS